MKSKFNWKEHPEIIHRLLELRNNGSTYKSISKQLNEEYKIDVSQSSVRNAFLFYSGKKEVMQLLSVSAYDIADRVNDDLISEKEYKATHEILKDGTHRSDRLILMSEEEGKNPVFLLQAHGFDPEKWELVTARNNMWHVYSVDDGQQVSYASRITVKPKTTEFSYKKFIEHILKCKPVTLSNKIRTKQPKEKRLLEIPIYDQHFGISDYSYYKETQQSIAEYIQYYPWEQVVFVIGSDLFHNDDFRGRTASGREIQTVDMEKAWDDARTFYEPLIRLANDHSNHVKIIFLKGNHDESMSWAFVQMLKTRFPTLEFDDSFEERKIHIFNNIFIGLTHGDKGKKNLHNIFPAEYPVEWAKATCREIHTGHIHREDVMDHFGTVVRTLATKNKTDQWHKDNGYVGNNKRFMLFEYNTKELKSIHYV